MWSAFDAQIRSGHQGASIRPRLTVDATESLSTLRYGEIVGIQHPVGGARLRRHAALAAWPALAFYLMAMPAAMSGARLAVGLFCFSGTVLAVALARNAAQRVRRSQRIMSHPRMTVAPHEH